MSANSPIWQGSDDLVEDADSPEFSFEDKVTCRRTLRGKFSVCWANRAYKGDVGTIPLPGVTDGEPPAGVSVSMVVSRATVKHGKGGQGVLVIEYGGAVDEQQLPEDETGIQHSQQEISVEKHPRWAHKFTGEMGLKVMECIEALLRCKNPDEHLDLDPEAFALVQSDPDINHVYWLRKAGVHTYALFPPTVTITSYSVEPPALSAGGFKELPPVDVLSIPLGLEFLRLGDQVTFNGTYYQLTKTWLGAPEWDAELYPDADA